MRRLLFLTWNGAGNQPPALAIAQVLRHRGHDVTFAGYDSQRPYFAERGFRFVPVGRSSIAWREEPPEGMFAVKLQTVWSSVDHLVDLPRLISEERSDAVVIDCLMFGALAAAENVSIPVANFIHSAPGALMPPGGKFEAQLLGSINRLRAHVGLPELGNLWEAWARYLSLSNSIRPLDPLADQAPASFRYLGPMAEELLPSGWKSPWAPSDRRPLVLVSFSTGPYWDQTSRILRTLDAIRTRKIRALVTVGPTEIDAYSVPNNAVIVRRIPHDEILPQVDLTITHAGHGTVTASLKHGVPLVCLPNLAGDQPILASQIQALGCGLALDGDSATSLEIGKAIDQVIEEHSFSARAQSLASTISESAGAAGAAEEVEQLLAL
jgi:UDP:flavonoid glycosyltransferase YjiC (YdhE family)